MTNQEIKQAVENVFDEVVTARRHIHQHPELSFEEYETAAYVKEKLTAAGIQPVSIGRTGVVAVIAPEGMENEPCLALRADLDALPIHEQSGESFSSGKPGVMHACGHDVHTAVLLGVAKIVQENKEQLLRPVKFIFQDRKSVV